MMLLYLSLTFVLGIFLSSWASLPPRESRVTLTGMVNDDPQPADRTVRLKIAVTVASTGGAPVPVDGRN
jgi:hypothetical protein